MTPSSNFFDCFILTPKIEVVKYSSLSVFMTLIAVFSN